MRKTFSNAFFHDFFTWKFTWKITFESVKLIKLDWWCESFFIKTQSYTHTLSLYSTYPLLFCGCLLKSKLPISFKDYKIKEYNYMEFLEQLSPFVENVGFPALIFAIWYIYHQSQVKAFEKIIQNNFEILKDLLETNQYHAALLSRIESKIDNNLWCPILKREVS